MKRWKRGLKWEVVFNGNRINVAMNDEGFLERIDHGERFAKGDGLDVELHIDQVLDPNIRTYLNKSYSVAKLISHVPRPEQSRLYFGDNPTTVLVSNETLEGALHEKSRLHEK